MTRRQLEQAVIAAARDLLAGYLRAVYNQSLATPGLVDAALRTTEAFKALDALKPLSAPRTARCAPVTSHTAAKWVASQGKTYQNLIFYKIYWSTSSGWTTDELIVHTGKGHQTISARVNELANAGWIVDSGRTRETRSGQQAIVWIASEAAVNAIDEGRQP